MRAPSSPIDPAADAAALLRRIGFATLMIALPVGALVVRRGTVVLVPVGIVLLIIATVLDGAHRGLRKSLQDVATSPVGLAAALMLAWCGLSLLWTPFGAPAAERFLNIVGTIAVGIAGYLALPERMRASNLYLLPIGAGLAAIVALVLAFTDLGIGDDDDQSLERGLIVLVVLLWPALAWLRSRQRHREALVLLVAVAIAAAAGPTYLPLAGLGVGALAYLLTSLNPPLGVRVTASVIAGLLAFAPLVPLIGRPIGSALFGAANPTVASLAAWRRVILNEPSRLITGHGFETALRGRFTGLFPPNAPTSLLFEIWYDLGIIGAVAGAAALFFAIMRAGRQEAPLGPAIMAAFAAPFTFACLGIGTSQMWWFTALVAGVLIFVATERGQFRTTRPKARLLPANDR